MSLFKSVATFGSFTLVSRITGFLRDMILAKYLGAGLVSDAFFVSFKFPNFFRSLFAEGAFTSAFVPMVSSKLCKEGKEEAIRFSSNAISVLAIFLAGFVALFELFMPYIVAVFAPGFAEDPVKLELATTLSRITFPFLLFISIVAFQSGILNSLGKFAAPAAAPIILNLLMIVFIFVFIPFTNNAAYGASIAVTVAGLVEILWLHYFLRKEEVFIRPSLKIRQILQDKEIKTLLRRIAPGIMGSGIYQINMMVDMIIVSLVGSGAISWLYYANRIQQLPLGVVGAAISVALLPVLSKHIKNEDHKEAAHSQDKAIEYGALLSIPATVILIVLAEPIVNILFQRGKFGALETTMTYQAVIAYAISLPFYVAVKALAPNFFARGDTKTPVKYSIIVFISNFIFAVALMFPFGHVGIATATTLASFVSFYQYCRGLKKRGHWSFSPALIKQIFRITICSIIMGIALEVGEIGINFVFPDWLSSHFIIKFAILSILGIFAVATFAFAAKILKVIDFRDIFRQLRRGK